MCEPQFALRPQPFFVRCAEKCKCWWLGFFPHDDDFVFYGSSWGSKGQNRRGENGRGDTVAVIIVVRRRGSRPFAVFQNDPARRVGVIPCWRAGVAGTNFLPSFACVCANCPHAAPAAAAAPKTRQRDPRGQQLVLPSFGRRGGSGRGVRAVCILKKAAAGAVCSARRGRKASLAMFKRVRKGLFAEFWAPRMQRARREGCFATTLKKRQNMTECEPKILPAGLGSHNSFCNIGRKTHAS